jgi:hypothetical protein
VPEPTAFNPEGPFIKIGHLIKQVRGVTKKSSPIIKYVGGNEGRGLMLEKKAEFEARLEYWRAGPEHGAYMAPERLPDCPEYGHLITGIKTIERLLEHGEVVTWDLHRELNVHGGGLVAAFVEITGK